MKWPWISRHAFDQTISMWRSTNERWTGAVRPIMSEVTKSIRRVEDCIEHAAGKTTPELMADIWSRWGSDKQAQFLNACGVNTSTWDHPRCMQFSSISEGIDDDGIAFVSELAEYVKDKHATTVP